MPESLTIPELVELARSEGYERVSKRLVYDWISIGLLDRPTIISRGRRGRVGVLDHVQRDLFFVLCAQRALLPSATRIVPHLCNVPVFLWLWNGPPFVPLRQARRALATWAAPTAGSWRRCVDTAYGLLEPFGCERHPGRPPTVVRTLATLLYRGQTTQENLTQLMLRAVSEAKSPPSPSYAQQWSSRSRTLEPTSLSIEEIAKEAAHAFGRRHETCRRLKQIPDSTFEWARITYLWKYPQYLAHRLELPVVPSAEEIMRFLAPQFSEIEWRACFDLVDTLGDAQDASRRNPDTIADPTLWERLNLRTDGFKIVSPTGVVLSDLGGPYRD